MTELTVRPAPPSPRQIVHVASYYRGQGSGGGDFEWRPSYAATPDGGAVIAPANNPSNCAQGCWVRQLPARAPLSTAMFGCKSDGIANDTQCTAAMLAAAAALRRTAFIEPNTVFSGIVLRGPQYNGLSVVAPYWKHAIDANGRPTAGLTFAATDGVSYQGKCDGQSSLQQKGFHGQFVHCLALMGVRKARISGSFVNVRGDGVYINQETNAAPSRQSSDITLDIACNNPVDDGRECLGLMSGDDVTAKVTSVNVGGLDLRPDRTPGGVDVEPNHPWQSVKRLRLTADLSCGQMASLCLALAGQPNNNITGARITATLHCGSREPNNFCGRIKNANDTTIDIKMATDYAGIVNGIQITNASGVRGQLTTTNFIVPLYIGQAAGLDLTIEAQGYGSVRGAPNGCNSGYGVLVNNALTDSVIRGRLIQNNPSSCPNAGVRWLAKSVVRNTKFDLSFVDQTGRQTFPANRYMNSGADVQNVTTSEDTAN